MGNIHVANASTKVLRVRVTQVRVTITEIDTSGSLSVKAFSLSGSVKASLDHTLDTTGFARLSPGEALEFEVNVGDGDSYVTVTTADDLEPMVIAYNYTPPSGRSVIVTDKWTLQLAKKYGDDVWRTDSGVCYGPSMAKGIKKQDAPDQTTPKEAERKKKREKKKREEEEKLACCVFHCCRKCKEL